MRCRLSPTADVPSHTSRGLPRDHKSGRFPASKVPVNKKNDDRADHRADQTSSLARSVPAEHLSEEAGYESANDAEDGGEDEPLRLIGSRHDEFSDNAREKPDDDRPDDAHLAFLHGFKGLSVLTGKPAVRREFVDGRRQFARKPGKKLVLRKAGLLLQGCQGIRPNRLFELRWSNLLVGAVIDTRLSHLFLTALLESLEQFTKTAAQKTSRAARRALSTQVTEHAAQTRLRAAAGLVAGCSCALEHFGDFVAVLVSRTREQSQKCCHRWFAGHINSPRLVAYGLSSSLQLHADGRYLAFERVRPAVEIIRRLRPKPGARIPSA